MTTKMEKILIGSHVPMTKSQNYLLGSVTTMVEQGANTFMIFTGPPQNTKRTPIDQLNSDTMKEILAKNQATSENLVVHAPYIINLGNQFNLEN